MKYSHGFECKKKRRVENYNNLSSQMPEPYIFWLGLCIFLSEIITTIVFFNFIFQGFSIYYLHENGYFLLFVNALVNKYSY